MKARFLIPIGLIASLSVLGLAACQAVAPSPGASAGSESSSGAVLPVDSNPIVNASTAPGLTITAAAEDNVDPVTNAPIDDRLQVTLQNETSQPLTSLEIYYVMTDVTTGQSEAYYQTLTGLTLAPNSTTTISFDGESGPGHYPENAFSIYRSSKNQVDFTIEVSAAGVQIAHATATLGSGAGDAAD